MSRALSTDAVYDAVSRLQTVDYPTATTMASAAQRAASRMTLPGRVLGHRLAFHRAAVILLPLMDSEFVGNYLTAGIHHVLTGWDHLLFAAALVLALTGFWEVFKIIGIFTVAHSISVVATALRGSALMPSWIVEPVIGASIVYIALENILRQKISLNPQRIVVVFLLGLVHGMGFGGALLEKLEGIEGHAAAWAIAAFCIGVEAGHLCVVAPLSGALKIGRDAGGEKFRQLVLMWGSALIALGGCYYFIMAVRSALVGAGG